MGNPLKTQITEITLDVMLGIREGVGKCRVVEFGEYIDDLVKAKEAGIDPDVLQRPMLTDRVRQGVEAVLSAKTKTGGEGGIEWKFISLGGSFDKQQDEGIRVNVDMEFMSIGAPDFSALKTSSIEDLKKLQEIVNK